MFFQTHKGSVTSFSILFNFQGPVHRSLAADSLFIIPQKRFLSSSFLKFFVFLERVISHQSLGFRPDFYVLILVLPFYFSATLRSHSFVPHLVLEYNTTLPPSCQHFFAVFLIFFDLSPTGCPEPFCVVLDLRLPFLLYQYGRSPAVERTAGDRVFFYCSCFI